MAISAAQLGAMRPAIRRARSLADIRSQATGRAPQQRMQPAKPTPDFADPNAPVQPGASASRVGPPPDDRYAGFYATPGYQFRQDEGARAIENSAAARGRLFSGGTIKGLTRYSQGVASDEFQNYVRGLAGIAGVGSGAAGAGASDAISTGRSIGSAYEQSGRGTGSAYAQGAQGVNQAVQGGIGNLAYIYGRSQDPYRHDPIPRRF